MVKVDFGIAVATVTECQWTSDNTEFAQILMSLSPAFGPSGDDPDRDMTLAQAAIDLLGGTISESVEPEYIEGTIY